jgi:hypothetical protein
MTRPEDDGWTDITVTWCPACWDPGTITAPWALQSTVPTQREAGKFVSNVWLSSIAFSPVKPSPAARSEIALK